MCVYIYIYIYTHIYIYIYIYIGRRHGRPAPPLREVLGKGTNGVSTSGVTRHFWEYKSRLTGVSKKSLCQKT